jgi:poly(A) polymerase
LSSAFAGKGGGSFGSPEALLDVAAEIAAGAPPPPQEITEAARAAAPLAAHIEPARVRAGIEAVIMGRSLDLGLQWMHDSGLLAVVLPELEATVDFSQEAGRRHKDVWEHTKQVVRQSVPKPAVRWSALLHDIGKVPTRVMLPDGRVAFHRHAEVGARMFDPIARRLGFDKNERQKVRFLIYHHLRANAYEAGWTDAAVRRFDHEMGPNLEELLDLSRADVTSRRPGRRQEAVGNIHAQGAHPGDPRAGRARAAAATGPRQRHHGDVRPAALEAHRRSAQAVRGGRRARRPRGAARGDVLRRLPARARTHQLAFTSIARAVLRSRDD